MNKSRCSKSSAAMRQLNKLNQMMERMIDTPVNKPVGESTTSGRTPKIIVVRK